MQDINYLIDLLNQLDLEFSSNRAHNYMPNSTKCMTWQDVKSSHETDSPQVVIRIDDIYGVVILLAMGLGGALVVLALELLMKTQIERSMKNNQVHGTDILLKQM